MLGKKLKTSIYTAAAPPEIAVRGLSYPFIFFALFLFENLLVVYSNVASY